jgi:bisphosphoglycerate-dependent phosphoglycerate mutase
VVKDLKIEDPLEFRTNIPFESAPHWNNLNELSINKVDRTYNKHGLKAPDEVKFEYGKRQIDIAVREQQSILDTDGYSQRQAKSAENVAWIPAIGDDRRRDILNANANRLQRKYGIEDITMPAFTRTLQSPPDETSLGSRLKRALKTTAKTTDEGVDYLADLEDNSGRPTESGNFVDEVITSVPFLSKSGALDAVDGAAQVAHGVKSVKFPIVSMYKYWTAHDNMLETTDKQHQLVRKRATAKHTENLKEKIYGRFKGKDKDNSKGKGRA